MSERDQQAEDARKNLASLSRESGLLGDARMPEGEGVGDGDGDAVEIWAKRIGRGLGLVFLILLAVNLFTGWFF